MSRKKKRKSPPADPARDADLDLRVSGTGLDGRLVAAIRDSADRALAAFARHIDRVKVHVTGSGPRGGGAKECQVKVLVSDGPAVLVKERASSTRLACEAAAGVAESTLRRLFDRQGWPAEVASGTAPPERVDRPNPPPEAGEIIGRRVGHGRADVEDAAERPEKARRDALVDTSQPGVSATERKAGGGSTARRNAKLSSDGMSSMLEDSAQDRPSRKSTRRSANRIKRDAPGRIARLMTVRSPKARANKATARHGSGGGS